MVYVIFVAGKLNVELQKFIFYILIQLVLKYIPISFFTQEDLFKVKMVLRCVPRGGEIYWSNTRAVVIPKVHITSMNLPGYFAFKVIPANA